MLSQEWFLLWALVAKGLKMICHPPYLPDLTSADFFLFLNMNSELAGLSLSQDSFQKSWEGVNQTISREG
jgi:hypothetical protein